MGSSELAGLSARGLADAIGAREVTAREVVEAHLRRIEAVDGAINAVVQLDAERALAARTRRTPPRASRWGPLHGVPFTVKDNLSAAGIPMAIGARERVGVVPDEDATAVARLTAAGGILLGKTNCPEYGGGIETDNQVYGRTRTRTTSRGRRAAAAAERRRSSPRRARRAGWARTPAPAPGCPRTSAGSPRSSRARGASR